MRLRGRPHLRSQYERLAQSVLWRLFKVLYIFACLIVVVAIFSTSYDVSCSDQTSAVWATIPDWRERPISVPCNGGEAFLAGAFGGGIAMLGLWLLFLFGRRIVVYVAYGGAHKSHHRQDST